ncbi:MAG: hypothetical protein II767_09365 [Proteobacteria bacterium]|nr:hypothetical protein [Pseudomonadota bacterium]
MRIVETFYKPGLETPDEVIESLPDVPRQLHVVGMRWAIAWRILCALLVLLLCAAVCYSSIVYYIESANFIAWMIAVAISPIGVGFVPWWLISSYRKHIKSYKYCSRLYEIGKVARGSINMLTRVTGFREDSHHIEHTWHSSRSRVRIDYTFDIDGSLKTGTMILREQSIPYLSLNTEVCVLYDPDDPKISMLFPIPSSDFFDALVK